MSQEKYTVSVIEKDGNVSVKDVIRAKDISNTISLDNVVNDSETLDIGKVKGFVKLTVHNPRSRDEKDYQKLVLISDDTDSNETRFYSTGSESFETSFMSLWEEVKELDEYWSIIVFKKPSKNYAGKGFLTCTVI